MYEITVGGTKYWWSGIKTPHQISKFIGNNAMQALKVITKQKTNQAALVAYFINNHDEQRNYATYVKQVSGFDLIEKFNLYPTPHIEGATRFNSPVAHSGVLGRLRKVES